MEGKKIEKEIQECFESIEQRTELEFSYQWCPPKKLTKTEVMVTLAESSQSHHGGEKFGFATKSQMGVYWICLFRDDLQKYIFEHSRFKKRAKEALTLVCIHEVLHILDYIKNGTHTKTEKEITQLAGYFTNNHNLPIYI